MIMMGYKTGYIEQREQVEKGLQADIHWEQHQQATAQSSTSTKVNKVGR